MHGERSLLIGVLWRVAVMLVLFNPVASLSQWMLASWQIRPGVVLIVLAVVALVLLYMLSLAREFLGATIVAALAIAADPRRLPAAGLGRPRRSPFLAVGGAGRRPASCSPPARPSPRSAAARPASARPTRRER